MGLWNVDLDVALNHLDDVLDNEGTGAWARELAVDSGELDTEINHVMEVLFELVACLWLEKVSQASAVGSNVNVVTELSGLKQDHAASRDSGWRGLRQIVDLEHYGHRWLQLNDLT